MNSYFVVNYRHSKALIIESWIIWKWLNNPTFNMEIEDDAVKTKIKEAYVAELQAAIESVKPTVKNKREEADRVQIRKKLADANQTYNNKKLLQRNKAIVKAHKQYLLVSNHPIET
jgi:hypothetical protein